MASRVDKLTPEAVLAAVAGAYRGFVEYEDTGVVSDGATPSVRFETRFRRGSFLRFAYTAFRPDGRKYHEGSVSSDQGKFAFSCSLGGPQPTSLRLGIAALTGISWGAAHGVPSLLVPEEVGGWLPTDMVRVARLPDEVVAGILCFHIQGDHPTQPAKYALLVDKSTFVIRRRVSRRSRQEVTDYDSCRAVQSSGPQNNKMQRTKHGKNGASPLICVFDGR
jgi:hypothetical protein